MSRGRNDPRLLLLLPVLIVSRLVFGEELGTLVLLGAGVIAFVAWSVRNVVKTAVQRYLPAAEPPALSTSVPTWWRMLPEHLAPLGFRAAPDSLECVIGDCRVLVRREGGEARLVLLGPIPRMTEEPTSEGIGAWDFDAKLTAVGSLHEMLAAFDDPTRAAVLAVYGQPGSVFSAKGSLELRLYPVGPSAVAVAATALLDVARHLRVRDEWAAVEERAAFDPEPGVRRRALHALARGRAASISEPLLKKALAEDPDPWVRVSAARLLGRHDDLPGMLEDSSLGFRARREALLGLLMDGPRERARTVAMGVFEDADMAPFRVTVFRAIRMRRIPEMEDALLACLDDEADPARSSALEALSVLGTARSIPALLAIVERGGVTAQAAGSALQTIRERIESNPGAISIVEDGAGQLSEAADREGALTVASPPRRTPTTT